MKTVIIAYEVACPTDIELYINRYFPNVLCNWKDIDEDYFEFTIMFCEPEWFAMIEEILADFV